MWLSHNTWTFLFLDMWNIHISIEPNLPYCIFYLLLKSYLCLLKRVKGFRGVTDYCIQLTQNDDYFFFIRLKVNLILCTILRSKQSSVLCIFWWSTILKADLCLYGMKRWGYKRQYSLMNSAGGIKWVRNPFIKY